MIEGGFEYGLLTTGETIAFFRVGWRHFRGRSAFEGTSCLYGQLVNTWHSASWLSVRQGALERDMRIQQAKIKMFQDCAIPIDQVLLKAGTELYPYATAFRSFFASRLDEWLTEHRSARRKTAAAAPTGEHFKPSYAQEAASRNTSAPLHGTQQNGAADERSEDCTDHTDRPRRKEQDDNRIFVRMDNSRLEPYRVKSTLVRRLGLDYQELREVTRCASGFTLHPRDKATQAKLLALQGEMIDILKARKTEEHVVWHHYKLRGCPRKVMTAEGLTVEIDETAVANEAELQTGVRPVRCVLSKHTSDGDAETDWLVSFTKEINRPFCNGSRQNATL
ncbi:hypothetical protein TruAng_011500 [Truncatella angustata]|nr:hypothetical protein TruAng_011500 [Truncatella angustata]